MKRKVWSPATSAGAAHRECGHLRPRRPQGQPDRGAGNGPQRNTPDMSRRAAVTEGCAAGRLAGRPRRPLTGVPGPRASAGRPTLLPRFWSECQYRGDRVVVPKLSFPRNPCALGRAEAGPRGGGRGGWAAASRALGMEPSSDSRLRACNPARCDFSRRKQDQGSPVGPSRVKGSGYRHPQHRRVPRAQRTQWGSARSARTLPSELRCRLNFCSDIFI